MCHDESLYIFTVLSVGREDLLLLIYVLIFNYVKRGYVAIKRQIEGHCIFTSTCVFYLTQGSRTVGEGRRDETSLVFGTIVRGVQTFLGTSMTERLREEFILVIRHV